MTAAMADFVMGSAPQIDPVLCRESRIGYDRVWRVAVNILSLAGGGGLMFPSRKTLSEATGIHDRDIATSLAVLEGSGVIRRDGYAHHPRGTQWLSVHWLPGWETSGAELMVDPRDVRVDAVACAEARVGRDRAWRVAFMLKALKGATTSVLAGAIGIGERQVRACLSALGAVVKGRQKQEKKEWRSAAVRLDPPHDAETTNTHTRPLPPTGGESSPRAHARGRVSPRSWAKWIGRGLVMPWEIFRDDYEADESLVPSTQLSRDASRRVAPKASKQPRGLRPVESWTPLDSAREFRDRYCQMYPMAPGATGDVAKIAQILGSLRSRYNHDARTEMKILQLWLDDPIDVRVRNPRVPAWKKWIAAFHRHYADAEAAVKHQEQAQGRDYTTAEGRHHRDVELPAQERAMEAVRESKGSYAALSKSVRSKETGR